MVKINEAYQEYLHYLSLKFKITTVKFIDYKFKNYILPYFKNKQIDKITLQEYVKFLKEINNLNYSNTFTSQIHSIMRGFFNYLKIKYSIKNIPEIIGEIKNTKFENKAILKTWTKQDFKKFIKHSDNKIYHALFNALFYTGIRKGEALALKINDLQNSYLTINKTITKELFNGKRLILPPKSKTSIRKIKIDPFLNYELKKLIKYYKKNYDDFNNDFFLFGGNKPISTTTLDRKKNEYCQKANIQQIRIHDFRHSHATILYEKNIKIKAIQQRLGHADISTTLNTYVHLNKKEEKRLIKAINLTHL